MNVGELLDQLEECNEDATVSCIIQLEKDASFYHTIVIRTEAGEELVDIIVMNISGEGITVKELKNYLKTYNAKIPVGIKENRRKPIRFPYQINEVENKGDIVFLKLPQLMGDLFKQ